MPEPTPASATLWGAFTPSPPPVPLPAAVSPAAAPVRPPGSSQRDPWVVPLLIVLICTTLLGALAALWCFMRLQRRRRGAVEKVVDEEAAGQRAHHDGWRTTQAAAGSAPVRRSHRHSTSVFTRLGLVVAVIVCRGLQTILPTSASILLSPVCTRLLRAACLCPCSLPRTCGRPV